MVGVIGNKQLKLLEENSQLYQQEVNLPGVAKVDPEMLHRKVATKLEPSISSKFDNSTLRKYRFS